MRTQGGGKEATVTRYRRIKCADHPLAAKDGCQYEHRVILYDKIGSGTHECHWCERVISWKGPESRIVVDHLDEDKWNNAPENLVPSCRTCNSRRASNPDFQTHCEAGHPWAENTYERPDGTGRFCSACAAIRERNRPPRPYKPRS